jgi:hypothetical protein
MITSQKHLLNYPSIILIHFLKLNNITIEKNKKIILIFLISLSIEIMLSIINNYKIKFIKILMNNSINKLLIIHNKILSSKEPSKQMHHNIDLINNKSIKE